MYKAIFLDRDGVINKKAPEEEYICSIESFEFLPGALEAITRISQSEYKLIIVTNQRGIARGKLKLEDLEAIHRYMISEIERHGGHVDRIYYCPHEEGECSCRKPLTGMLENAKNDEEISLERSWVIGDSLSDILLGNNGQCKTIYIGEDSEAIELSDFQKDSLLSSVDLIL